MTALDVDRATAHDAAQRELDKPIYPKGSLPQRIEEWLHELIYRIVEQGSSLPGGWFTAGVLLILLVVASVLAIRIGRRTTRTRHDRDYQLFDDGQLSADQHRIIAEQCAADEKWSAAIRHRLRAVARALEENGTLPAEPGRTAGELARDAAEKLPQLAPELSSAATTFNVVTYGEDPGTPAAYQVIADLDGHLRSRTPPHRFVGPGKPVANSWRPIR